MWKCQKNAIYSSSGENEKIELGMGILLCAYVQFAVYILTLGISVVICNPSQSLRLRDSVQNDKMLGHAGKQTREHAH